ncbi:MAG: dTDP-4-dehydrorhamnose 3,5-epimerase family protein [Opitutales bacterium]|nr:dTDP-4-dehydrorhamnose 3,5-epimerase family protein [Opitutales bacterium]
MNFITNKFSGVCLVEPLSFPDERGSFSRLWCDHEFAKETFPFRPEQLNFVRSIQQGTIRGLHYQKAPYQIAKLISCLKGSIHNIFLDLRPESPTYLQWEGITLTGPDPRMLLVPEGFANGYQTLEENSEVFYMINACHNPSAETGIRWNDPRFGFKWKEIPGRTISEKDENWPDFRERSVSGP